MYSGSWFPNACSQGTKHSLRGHIKKFYSQCILKLFKRQVNNPLFVQHIISTYPAVGGFYPSVIMNNSSKNMSVKYLYDTLEFIWIYDQY